MKFDLDLFKMGYVILYKNDGGKFGRAIVKKQLAVGFSKDQAQFTHVEISGGDEHSVNIAPPKARHIDITKVHKGRYIQLVKYKNLQYDLGKRYKVAYFSALLANKGYDFGGIFAFGFKWIKQSNRLYFCSEGCAWAFQQVFPDIFHEPPDKIYPADFASNLFQVIWEGIIE